MVQKSNPHFSAPQRVYRRSGSISRLLCGALLACFCLCVGACRKEAAPHLAQGDRLLALGQPRQAIISYQAALEVEPSAHAERGLGLAYEALAAFAPAERHLLSALERKPGDVGARVALARVSTHFGRYERARNELVEVLDRDPDHAEAALLLGVYAETRMEAQRASERIEAQLERQRKLKRPIGHESQLVLADLMARLNRADAAAKLRDGIRYTPLGQVPLTLTLARASIDRDNHDLARRLLAPLVDRYPAQVDAWQILARAALEVGSVPEARAALTHLAARATSPEVRLLRAQIDLASGRETTPLAELRSLIGDLPGGDPLRGRARRVLGDALSAQGKAAEAQAELARLLEERPHDVAGTLALASLHLEQKQSESAVQLLSTLADSHGRLARAYLLLGQAHLSGGRLEAAEQAFRRLWELSPHEPDARYWIALTLERRGQLEQARRLLEGNLKSFPSHESSMMSMLRVIERTDGARAAKSYVVAHGSEHAESPEIAALAGRWLLEHQDTERALMAFRRALVQNPSYFPAILGLTRFYARHGKASLAYSTIDGALVSDSKNLALLLLGARIAADLGRYDQAREYCERALAAHPEHPLALSELASIEAEGFRNLDKAERLVRQAFAEAPSRPEVLDARGWVTRLRGDPARALEHLEAAVQKSPGDARLLYHLGAALLAAGQPKAANERFAEVLRLDPLFPAADELRTLLARG